MENRQSGIYLDTQTLNKDNRLTITTLMRDILGIQKDPNKALDIFIDRNSKSITIRKADPENQQ